MDSTLASNGEYFEPRDQFDFRRTDMWRRITWARAFFAKAKNLSFDHLPLRTTDGGVLCGARFFEAGFLFGKRDVLNLYIANDRGLEMQVLNPFGWNASLTGYSVWAHRAGYEPIELFAANGPIYR